jgi:hypothetical protein
MEHMGGHFVPNDDDFLHSWLADAKSYSNGRRVEAPIFPMNPRRRQKQLSHHAQWILRHIFFAFNLPVNIVGAILASFYVLIVDRPII